MVRLEVIDSRAVITIDDPSRRNPMTNETMGRLLDAVRSATADDDVRVLVITGGGDDAFSAGGDLKGGFIDDAAAGHKSRGALVHLIRALRACPKPTIARVNGLALGGGFGLAAACDIVIASDAAAMGTPEIRVGLWPMIITAVLQPLVPQKALFEMMATGRIVSAEEARDLGVVSRVVAHGDLDAAIDETVNALVRYSPAVLALGKRAFYSAEGMDFDTALEYLQTGLTAVASTADAAEGVQAFVEKRDPNWTGR